MNYTETLNYLYSQLPMFQRQGAVAYKNNLENTEALDRYFDHPHRQFKTVHVAGTNGKGSVSHMLAAILQCAGYKVGLYTSPHLKDFRERIRVNGAFISEEAVVDFVARFQEMKAETPIEPSFFELTVTMAFDYFRTQQVDVAVVEVGLGGRLDSTNVITPELSVITNISFDHTALLGNTLALIAAEKAGIIKPNVPLVVGAVAAETRPVFEVKSSEAQAPMVVASEAYSLNLISENEFNIEFEGELKLKGAKPELQGIYQLENLLTVFAAVEQLRKRGFDLSDEAIHQGLQHVCQLTGLMGRWQKLGELPTVICDTGHNEAGIRLVVQQIAQTPHRNLHMVFGVVNDKDVTSILKLLPTSARYYFAKASVERALDAVQLQQLAAEAGLHGDAFPTVNQAFEAARAQAQTDDLIFIGGSTFVVADIL